MRLPYPPFPSTREGWLRQQETLRAQRAEVKRVSFLKKVVCTFGFLFLSGCATTERVVYVETPLDQRIPAGLLTCKPRPTPDDTDTQAGVAEWIVDLDAARQDCRNKLNAVGRLVEADRTAGQPERTDETKRPGAGGSGRV